MSGTFGSREANSGAWRRASPEAWRVVVAAIEIAPVVETETHLHGERVPEILLARRRIAERDAIGMHAQQVVNRARAADAVLPIGEQMNVVAPRGEFAQRGLEVPEESEVID